MADYGLHTVVVSDRPGLHYNQVGNAGQDGDVTLHIVETLGYDTVLDLAARYAGRIAGITTTSELFLLLTAHVRESLDLPGKTREYTIKLRDKWAMKQAARAFDIRTAAGVLAPAALADDWTRARWDPDASRFFVKPRWLSGSRGTNEAHGSTELRRLLDRLGPQAGDYLVEEYVDGPLFHIDGLVTAGSLDFIVSAYERPTHTAGGGIPLSSATVDDPELLGRAGDFISSVVEAWGLYDEVFHCEAFLVDGDFVFCELAGRPGGAGVPEVYDLVRGIDLRWAKTALDLGLSPARLPSRLNVRFGAGGWTVIYDPPASDPTFRGFTEHVTADIRPPAMQRTNGHTGVGAATFVFGAQTTTGVRDQMRRCEDRASSGSRSEQRL